MKVLRVTRDITVTIDERDPENPAGGSIETTLRREVCPGCDSASCCYDCDGSHYRDHAEEQESDVAGRLMYNGALDGIESLILACAVAGIDVESHAFVEAVETALDAASEKYT